MAASLDTSANKKPPGQASKSDDEGHDDALPENHDGKPARFAPEEETELLNEANKHKGEANELFGRGRFDAALTAYEAAVAVLPYYLLYDLAVLRSNMAACFIKQEAWKEAVEVATKALASLDEEQQQAAEKKEETDESGKQKKSTTENDDDDAEEEIISEGATQAAQVPLTTAAADADKRVRLRTKILLRRAKARAELGGWANLAGAEEDYRAVVVLAADKNKAAVGKPVLSTADRKFVDAQLRQLPPRTKAAQEQEMGEMWGKLKELGNGILRPFGMSTDNFQMVKDEKTGGYSMNFRPNGSQ